VTDQVDRRGGGGAGPAEGTRLVVAAPVQGTVVQVPLGVGDTVEDGSPLVVLESMKMEHVVRSPVTGVVRVVAVEVGALVAVGEALAAVEATTEPVEAGEPARGAGSDSSSIDSEAARPDLLELRVRQRGTLDAGRAEVVERRHRQGRRTARENIDDLCDPGSFTEYGSLAIAAQRGRRPLEELIERTPADGLVAGVGRVNGDRFDDSRSRCAVLSYDYTVMAGTQGAQNHRKKDRIFELVRRLRLPVVLFAEGGGGRPGDTDYAVISGLDTMAFAEFGALSGLVPSVGVVSGYCFAGNAALLGCCDVIIATPGSSIGMGGPAMIEGGGLGTVRPEEIGPLSVQVPNGVVDVVAEDEADAVALARQYLGYFQGLTDPWTCADQRRLRSAVPPERRRVYDVRQLITTLADAGSVLELRRGFGEGMVTALVRVEGRPVGVVANNPAHLGGAIDRDGADKAARFLQLCDAHDLPLLFLCDTPGFMVGPEAETTAQVRHFSRLFVIGASLTVPFFTIVLRKGYGLGAQAMAGGSFRSPVFTVAWPTGEFGGMGLEGSVRLGFRRELEAVEDPAERDALFATMVDRAYQRGKAINVASAYEIDDVIDPADSRRRIVEALRSAPPPAERSGKKRSCIDTW
jgi:acetyl-CoA carboxylase carboxyltransferase component